jgi:succinoglycan biosynthesis protein ExoM
MRVVIGVCTAHRPEMLAACLDALSQQTAPDGARVDLLVVDNEPEPNNGLAVAQFASVCPFPVHYAHEPRRGIPRARNAILRGAFSIGADWVAMTDDDCRPDRAWLAAMLEAAGRHSADVVRGRHVWLPPEPAPYWFVPPSLPAYCDGDRINHAGGGNVLFAGWIGERLEFDERLHHGEDTDFFYRAALCGARVVYSEAPVVYEGIPRHRATLRYQTMRSFYYAASRAHFHRRHSGLGKVAANVGTRLLIQAPAAVLRLALAPAALLLGERRFKRHVSRGLARLAGAAGAVSGAAGVIGNPYRKRSL